MGKASIKEPINPIEKSHTWAKSGVVEVDIELPSYIGDIVSVVSNVFPSGKVVTEAGYDNGKFTYTLASNSKEDIGMRGAVSYIVKTQNYNDIFVDVFIEITDKQAQNSIPRCSILI